jgi:hypothetical protein
MNEAPIADLVERLRYIRTNMGEVLDTFANMPPPERDVLRVRIERWVLAVDSVIAQGERHLGASAETIPAEELNSSNDE